MEIDQNLLPHWKTLIAGGDEPTSAYCEAVVEGLIDPNTVSLSRFIAHVPGEYYVDPEIFAERKLSQFQVCRVMKR